ncbi:MAG: glycosyltransferase family 2 protein [Candidatus Eremiobacterota bacterium]
MEVNNGNNDILVIIPAYNEEKNISFIIEHIIKMGYKVLVVDDCSSDNTVYIAQKAGAIIVSHSINLRYGAAIQSGYKYALSRGYKYVVQIDADGQHNPENIPELLAPVIENKADLVIGSRFLGKCDYKIPFVRNIGINIFSFLTSFIIKQKITDPTSGYQALNEKVMKYYVTDSFPHDFPDADVIIKAHKKNFNIMEIPVHMSDRKNGFSMHEHFFPIGYYIFKMFLSIFIELLTRKT